MKILVASSPDPGCIIAGTERGLGQDGVIVGAELPYPSSGLV